MAQTIGDGERYITKFQSPSRGGHLRGTAGQGRCRAPGSVSVPFTRGTPPWLQIPLTTTLYMSFQSPSRGGHLRGGTRSLTATVLSAFQSPSRGGHLRGGEIALVAGSSIHVSVPFTRGTPPWHVLLASAGPGDSVSVPFTRGTPPWRTSPAHRSERSVAFQSPSRGGHLRGCGTPGS